MLPLYSAVQFSAIGTVSDEVFLDSYNADLVQIKKMFVKNSLFISKPQRIPHLIVTICRSFLKIPALVAQCVKGLLPR